MTQKRSRYLSVLLVLALVLAAVGIATVPANAQAAPKKLVFAGVQSTGDIPTIDPGLVKDTASAQVVNATFVPLVNAMEEDLNKVLPGMAEKWSTSQDGLTWTFNIRKNVPWVMWDGSKVVKVQKDGKDVMVNARDIEYGMKRMLAPATASDYAYVFYDSLGIKGAKEFSTYKPAEGQQPDAAKLKELEDAVGIKATDDFTLTITLSEPLGFVLGVLKLPQTSAVSKDVVEKNGDKWTEPGTSVSYGPYVVSEWRHDESLTLVKNPFWNGDIPNSPKPKIDEILIPFLDDAAQFANYEAGSADISNLPLPEVDRVKGDATLSKELRIGPSFSTYYYGYNVTKEPFTDARVRRAFSYAVDRQSIVDNVTKTGQIPARWFTRPGLAGAPPESWKGGIGFDAEKAKAELKAYLDEKKITVDQLPPITLVVNQVEGHIKIAEAIQQMWEKNLGVKVQLQAQEWKVFLETLENDPAQIWRLGWNLDYPDASNFAKDVFLSTSSNNHTKWKSAEYDKIVNDAAKLTDNAKRIALYQQSEDILIVKDAVIIPIYWYTRVNMTKPYVKRTYAVSTGDERLEKFDLTK
jgi:oligopeptide transport system substrate-binding protein